MRMIKPELDTSWQDFSNCLGVDPTLFFPERGASTIEAKEVCRGCAVREDCLQFALQNGEKFGIWGGMSERERRRIRRQRALAKTAAAAIKVDVSADFASNEVLEDLSTPDSVSSIWDDSPHDAAVPAHLDYVDVSVLGKAPSTDFGTIE